MKIKLINDPKVKCGYIDSFSQDGYHITISGWAMNPFSKTPADKVIITDRSGHFLSSGDVCIERPDVQNVVGKECLQCGWRIQELLKSDTYHAYAYNSQKKEAYFIGSISPTIPSLTTQKKAEENFSTIYQNAINVSGDLPDKNAPVFNKIDNESEIFTRIDAFGENFDAIVDIIIPIYNAYDDLVQCINSIFVHTRDANLILIDDASPDPRISLLLDDIERKKNDKIVVLRNESNQGFIATVNRGMRHSKKDVILLNSDTIVTKNWTRKLFDCANSSKYIATATPFSNNATICSVPEFCKDNTVPQGFTIDTFGNLIENISKKRYPEIPTAVGFCMYIKREALDKIGYFDADAFGRGYAEENDFCMRAVASGFTNVLCDDTYIYHKGASSFTIESNERCRINLEKLNKRYPNYNQIIHYFITSNPLLSLHKNINKSISLIGNGKKNILYILHNWGGGTETHVHDLIRGQKNDYNLFLFVNKGSTFDLIYYSGNDKRCHSFPINLKLNPIRHNKEYADLINQILDDFHIHLVHVHQLIGHSIDVLYSAHERHIPVIATIHDFYWICEKINLVKDNNQYCSREKHFATCAHCLNPSGDPVRRIIEWRKSMNDALFLCSHIIVPSTSAGEIISEYYPILKDKIIKISHGTAIITTACSSNPSPRTDQNLNIAYIGGLSYVKGKNEIVRMIHDPRIKKSTRWFIFGDIQGDRKILSKGKNVKIFGRYKDLPDLLEQLNKNKIDLILFPAIWPETFSYTLSEAWMAGIPVICSDLGALGERVIKTNGGWAVKNNEYEQYIAIIQRIIASPDELILKRKSVQDIKFKTLTDMNKQYSELYYSLMNKPNSKILLSEEKCD